MVPLAEGSVLGRYESPLFKLNICTHVSGKFHGPMLCGTYLLRVETRRGPDGQRVEGDEVRCLVKTSTIRTDSGNEQ